MPFRSALFAVLLTGSAVAEPRPPFTGKCVGVTDGDTLSVLTASRETVKVRLQGIDAPERGQPFGAAAKQALSALAFGKQVEVRPTGNDRDDRLIADVFASGTWVKLQLVEGGHAWRFDRYSQNAALGAAQERAQEARRGLWSGKGPVAPWLWRKFKAGQSNTTVAAPQR